VIRFGVPGTHSQRLFILNPIPFGMLMNTSPATPDGSRANNSLRLFPFRSARVRSGELYVVGAPRFFFLFSKTSLPSPKGDPPWKVSSNNRGPVKRLFLSSFFFPSVRPCRPFLPGRALLIRPSESSTLNDVPNPAPFSPPPTVAR